MSRDTVFLVLNHKALGKPGVKDAVRAVRAEGVDLEVRIPWGGRDRERVVQEALDAGAKRIVAGGGDGTLNRIANLLLGDGSRPSGVAVGIFPTGTANDFAHARGLPVEDLEECLRIACSAEPRLIDVGKANDRIFVNVVSGGFGAEITATTPVKMKKALGAGAYTLWGLAKATNLKPYRSRLLVPGEDPVEGEWLIMAVGNSQLAGGGFEVAPRAELDDGKLDLAAVLADSPLRAELSKLLSEWRHPMDPDNEVLAYRQLTEFTLESESEVQFNLDGEPMKARRVLFAVLRSRLPVIW